MSAHVTDEIDPHPARSLIVDVAVQAQGTEVTFEFAAKEGCGLAAAGVAGFLGAQEYQVGVRTGSGAKGGGRVCWWWDL